jgi:hypothetical protein
MKPARGDFFSGQQAVLEGASKAKKDKKGKKGQETFLGLLAPFCPSCPFLPETCLLPSAPNRE